MSAMSEHEAALKAAIQSAAAGPWGNLSRVERAVRRFARAGRQQGLPPERMLIRLKELSRPAVQPLLATERRAWALHVLSAAVNAAVSSVFVETERVATPPVAAPS
ncbi:MAG TPA: hypothetical protein VNV25_22435 [Gemmatimonadaceae bacterium]|nr:hypothetical protein [Gemmatimonadaceae bacterium]